MTGVVGKWIIIVETHKYYRSNVVLPPKLVTRDCPKTIYVKQGFGEVRYRKDRCKFKSFDDKDRANSAYNHLCRLTGLNEENRLCELYRQASDERVKKTKQLIENW